MNADKKSRSAGTVCITDCRRKAAELPEKPMQSQPGPHVMSHSTETPDTLKSAPSSPDLPEAADALETLRASQKLIHLGRLTASIAHEVNNPLESVTNLLYLIRSEPGLPQGVLAYLDMAEREMERVVTISKQTLNFVRETNEPSELSLPDLLEEVLVLYRRRIDEKLIRIVQQYTPTETIRAIPGEMRQVLANLIVNAIEASSPHGCLTLRVRPVIAARRTHGIRITIADNGTGIPPEIRRRLGQPFFTTKGQRGTGLGLWVSRSILERYGGRLRLRSVHTSEPTGDARHGTVFALFLPLRTTAHPQSKTGTGSGPVLVSRTANPNREKHGHSMRRTAGNR